MGNYKFQAEEEEEEETDGVRRRVAAAVMAVVVIVVVKTMDVYEWSAHSNTWWSNQSNTRDTKLPTIARL